MHRNIAPGARITLRDEDWIVRRIDLSDDSGHALTCDGLSKLVRGTSAIFLDKLEDDIEVHDPSNTQLFQDESAYFTNSLLYLESQRLRTVANDQHVHRAHQAAMKAAAYQRVPAEKVLKQVRTRILIADGVGLGKTLEAAMLATELDIRGRGRRILVVTQKSMLTQFQKEWWSRFTIPLVRLDSAGIQRIRNNIPSGHNPFNYYDKTIVSMDTLKGNNEYRNYLDKSRWDIIVIDECHNVAVRKSDSGSSLRARLAKNLATKSDTLILLSATPHDGSAKSFASLIWLLDPTAISDPDDYTRADLDRKDLFVRRFKKDVKGQAHGQFPEPVTRRLSSRASPEEEAAFQAVLEIPFTQKGERMHGKQSELQRVGLQKALFSSPAAANAYAGNRIEKLRRKPLPTEAENEEVAALETLQQTLERITPERFSKYQRLLTALRDLEAQWTGKDTKDRLVIFSERIETLKWLKSSLPGDLRLKEDSFTVMDGRLSDIDQQEIVERFGQEHDSLRVLLCSDVASEGLNLHYLCHRLVHFDLPWSPMVFQQRNGRVDRFGQEIKPRIDYLLTESGIDKVKGDLRVIEVLVRKDEQISQNIGDPASILRKHSVEEEEQVVADALANGMNAEQFEEQCINQAAVEDDDDDWEAAAADDADTDDEAGEGANDYGGTTDLLGNGWFVTKDKIGEYKNSEKVTFTNAEGRKELRVYHKGSFIYRLAGRDRQKSASYYTPQSLTQCLVKYALKELLQDKSADDILELRVLEPAMGSAAFLNEAVNQLAEAYLTRKQIELGRRIPHDQYAQELQKVRMRLADSNVFGVDLNPIATELAEVSLWLNAIYGETDDTGRPKPARVPWFGYQLFNGNSLVGARPQVFRASQLNAPKKIRNAPGKSDTKSKSVPNPQCYLNAAPRRLKPGEKRRDDEIYHFLLPDEGLCDYANKAIKEFFGARLEQVKAWKKPLLARFSDIEIRRLQQLSGKIDELWQEHARQLAHDRARTDDSLPVWPDTAEGSITSRASKEETRKAGMLSEDGDKATPYRRLKLVMDYWCALWFWPLDPDQVGAQTLPSCTQWITEIGAILEGNVMEIEEQSELDLDGGMAAGADVGAASAASPNRDMRLKPHLHEVQASLFDDLPGQLPLAAPADVRLTPHLHDRYGELRIKRLREHFPRVTQVEALATRFRFCHWELSFADIFRESGGFDLILGNPPWLKVEWEEKGILGEADPKIAIRKMSASDLTRRRAALFSERPDMRGPWLKEFCEQAGMQAFLNATQNYPQLKGVQTNLYKCFLPQAWMLGGGKGVAGFLHPEGIYNDPKGGRFRAEVYPRLRGHFQFINETKLFSEVHNQTLFSINIYGPYHEEPHFRHISNLFIPQTIDVCHNHNGEGRVPGIKQEVELPDGKVKVHWDFSGHRDRVLPIGTHELTLFAKLYDEKGTPPLRARLPALHSRQLIGVLEKIAAQSRCLGDIRGDYFSTVMFDETYAQRDGTIRRETRFPDQAGQWVLYGPHFFVGNPFYNTPRTVCSSNKAYDSLDLTNLPDDWGLGKY